MVAPTSEAASNPRVVSAPSDERHAADVYVRTSWADAALALSEYEKGKIDGVAWALWSRAQLQSRLSALGVFVQGHAGKVLFVAVLVLASFAVGLKSAQVHSRVDQLWVQEGGRLEEELRYTIKALGEADSSTHQLLIQAAREPDSSTLHTGALLDHLRVLRAAAHVQFHMYDVTWRLKDMCYRPNVPNFDVHYIDQIFDSIIPCSIITPLDCFWEGSKLLGPDYPVSVPSAQNNLQLTNLQWTNLNPMKMVEQMKPLDFQFQFSTLEAIMKRAGISSGYTEKPCLDPSDAHCPDTAPNKKTGQIPDVGAVLTGGCYGFAATYMHWPEQLLVGGVTHNKSGHLKKASALQSVVQLMGERELFEYWSETEKVNHISWTREKASTVLETWQRMFAEEVRKMVKTEDVSPSYGFFAFSTATLNEILGKFSEWSLKNIIIGYVCMLLYVAATLVKWQDPVKSQAGVGIAGVLLLSFSVAAGLGFCAILGMPFNASTTQIIPFLALGLGVEDVFLLTHTYVEQTHAHVPREERTAEVLKRSGLSVLLTSLCNVAAFFAAALIPIPALRVFSLQAAILLLFNLAATLLVFPAMISIDLRRRSAFRSDLLCCFIPESAGGGGGGARARRHLAKRQAVTRALPPDRLHTVTSVVDKEKTWQDSSQEPLDPESMELQSGCQTPSCFSLTLTNIAKKHYGPFIMKPAVKVTSMLVLFVLLTASLYGATKVTDGLDLTDIVPANTEQYEFLQMQEKYFGFYNMYAVTQGDFEYPTNQKLLYEYHDAFVRIPNIIKNDDGGLPKFWLTYFRDWLIDLQKAFDKAYQDGSITRERWFPNATDEAILAYKLLVQTGHVDNPIEKSLITQVKLVDDEGIINPRAFYNYLSAWVSNDALAYGASQGNLKPEPKQWFHSPADFELNIPKSRRLIYTQLPFYLHGLTDTEHIKQLIATVRALCERFEAKGLANFPSGIPFMFWEQYLYLRPSLALALACALGAVFLAVMVLLLNFWAAVLVVGAVAALVLQLLGAMAAMDIKLSAIPAVLLIVSVGIGVHFTVHLCLGFVTSIGGRSRRSRLALECAFAPVLHGAAATLVSAGMLATSPFAFVARHFVRMLLAVVAAGLLNGLLFFPVLLALVGPQSEVRPLEHPERLSTPSPKASPKYQRRSRNSKSSSGSASGPPRAPKPPPPPRPPSLTTITEEPGSWQSQSSQSVQSSVQSSLQSFVVQPEVVVETTTYNTDQTSDTSGRSSPSGKSPHPPGAITTKVTATTNIKVEVVTPMPSDRHKRPSRTYHYYDRDRRDRRDQDRDRERYRDRDRDRERDYDRRDRDRDRERDRDVRRDRDRRDYRDERDREREYPGYYGRDSGHESDRDRESPRH